MAKRGPSLDRAPALLDRPRLSDVESGRWNNLNLIRVVLASLVILSHCYVLMDRYSDEPMQRWLRFNDLGGTAVLSFFFLSGFLIFKSAVRSTPERFIMARALRIFPALIAVSSVCALLLGPAMTQLAPSVYFGEAGTWRYLGNGLLHIESGTLPGVFADRSDRLVNQPLWTLPAEWTMYIVMWVLCFAVSIRRGGGLSPARLALAAAVILFTLTLPALPWQHASKWFAFAGVGALAYLARRWIPLSIPAAVLLVAACIAGLLAVPIVGKALFAPALAYGLLVTGFHPALHLRAYHRLGDYSYGLYILGWPFQQLVFDRSATPEAMFAAAYPMALAAAVLSWHFIEGPCLRFKDSLRRRERPAPDADAAPSCLQGLKA